MKDRRKKSKYCAFRVFHQQVGRFCYEVWKGKMLPVRIRCSVLCPGETRTIQVACEWKDTLMIVDGKCGVCGQKLVAAIEFKEMSESSLKRFCETIFLKGKELMAARRLMKRRWDDAKH